MIDNFWGQHRFLSNFYPCVINYEGIIYPSTEHAYQAAKVLDTSTRYDISLMSTPGQAKKAGRIVKLREDWEHIKVSVMNTILCQKFQDDQLAQKLVETYPHELVEGNTWGDRFWGVCNGEGQNMLGVLLMQIRNQKRFTN